MKIGKKVISLILAFLLVMNMGISAFAAETPGVTLSVDETSYDVGDIVTVTVTSSGISNVYGFGLKVHAPKDVFTSESIEAPAGWATNTSKFASNGWIKVATTGNGNNLTVPETVAVIKLKATQAAESVSIYIDSLEVTLSGVPEEEKYVTVSQPQPVTTQITAKSDPVDPPVVAEGYSVSAVDAVSPINVNGRASVQVMVAHGAAEVNSYNAYDLTITYPEGLQYESAAGPDAENFSVTADETNRTVHVLGYGADKKFTVPVVTLEFTGLAVGEHNVTVTSAKVDAAAKALQDAPPATITDETGMIKVVGYTVTLSGDGLSADSTTAIPDQVYTFKAADDKYYNYTITATIGEKTIEIEDNDTGIYTIAGEEITGNITITAARTERTYNVTVNHIVNGETTSETLTNAATYNKIYEFTPVKDGHTVENVTYAIGDGEAVSLPGENGNYTIPAEKVTGAIVINITWKASGGDEPDPDEKTVNVTKPDYVIGDNTATKGENYQFSFKETAKYDYSDLKITVGDKELEKDKDYTGPDENGKYTILGAAITGDIKIEVTQTAKYTINVTQYVTLNNKDKAENEKVSMYLVTVSGVPEGYVAKYSGATMYWSEKNETAQTGYDAYAYLVISTERQSDFEKTAADAVSVVEKANGNFDAFSVNYNGNVNGTTDTAGNAVIDVNDAQLVYNMYMAAYSDFATANMEMFLRADMNGSKTVETADAATIIDIIKG